MSNKLLDPLSDLPTLPADHAWAVVETRSGRAYELRIVRTGPNGGWTFTGYANIVRDNKFPTEIIEEEYQGRTYEYLDGVALHVLNPESIIATANYIFDKFSGTTSKERAEEKYLGVFPNNGEMND